MAESFNEVQKQKRAQIAERKRAIHGDPATEKLKNRSQPLSISGKRKRKPLKKWRREQKEVIQKDLVSMEDVEMVASDGIFLLSHFFGIFFFFFAILLVILTLVDNFMPILLFENCNYS
ncbi:hypothetical protein REPUB_Repub11eG0120900 [Reevesia pubescens]